MAKVTDVAARGVVSVSIISRCTVIKARKTFRVVAISTAVFVVLAVTAIIFGMFYLAMPHNGELKMRGLDSSVTITRDKNAVPHIVGHSRDDVIQGLGFAHAQDRLWQMEMLRMTAKGRLSEIVGGSAVGLDVYFRTLNLYGAAESSEINLIEADRRTLEAYARGVNEFISYSWTALIPKHSVEFMLLRHKPEPWSSSDVIASMKMIAVILSSNVDEELLRLKFAAIGMSSTEMGDLLPQVNGDEQTALPSLQDILKIDLRARDFSPKEDRFARLSDLVGTGASNSWVVPGAKTTSGKPILANDTHMYLSAPSTWYLAHLRVERPGQQPRNMVGATLPGIPLVLLGRNNSVAWGFTNALVDVQDIYIEKVHPSNPNLYLSPSGYVPFDRQLESIRVRGERDLTFERLATRHGPVLPDDYKDHKRYLPKDTVAALQWTALSTTDKTVSAGLRMWDFDGVEDFLSGMSDFVAPVQAMVLADKDGRFAMLALGNVPLRKQDNKILGRAPSPGWDAAYDWNGFIPFQEWLRIQEPLEGIATANNKLGAQKFDHFLTSDWDEGWRFDRIASSVLQNSNPHSISRSVHAQMDDFSPAYAELAPIMLNAIRGRADLDELVIRRLREWDFIENSSNVDSLIFNAWLRHATHKIVGDELGEVFKNYWRPRAGAFLRWISDSPSRDWCDDLLTPQHETCSDALAASLNEALIDLRKRLGPEIESWDVKVVHHTKSSHAPFSKLPILSNLFDVSTPSRGGAYTLNRAIPEWGNEKEPYVVKFGTSYRGVFDLGDLNNSRFIISSGQSGNVLSPYYRDFAQTLATGQSIQISDTPEVFSVGSLSTWYLTLPQLPLETKP